MYTNFSLTPTPHSFNGLFNGKINIFDIVSSIINYLGSFGQTLCIISLLIGILGCFFGFRLSKFFIGLCGFCTGSIVGIILKIKTGSSGYLLLGLILAVILAILSYKLYKIGVFIISFLNGTTFSFTHSLMLFKDYKTALIFACIVGLVVGIISVFFTKSTIIVSTALSFGNMAGLFLAVLISNENMSKVLPLVFILTGFLIQIKTNGLFEGVTKIATDKIEEKIS